MQHTLIAVFDNHNDAVSAKNELLSSGFSESDVRLSHGNEDPAMASKGVTPAGSMTDTSVTRTDDEPGIGTSIKNFFSDIFGADSDEHHAKYSNAVAQGNHVLTVNTDSEPEVERAADIVERYGPVDIDEQSEKWASGAGLGGGMGDMNSPGAGVMGVGAGGLQQSQSMSLQSDNDRLPLNQQSLNDPNPMGTTYQEPMSSHDQLSAGSYGTGSGNLQTSMGSSNPSAGSDAMKASSGSSSLSGSSSSLQGSSLEGSAKSTASMQDASLTGSSLSGSSSSSLSGSQQRDTNTAAIPVVQEQLKVGKREVQRGGVRVFSRVVETPVNESIGLREEHVNVQRRPVNEPISTTDSSAFKEQSIEMRETAEEAVVEKSARVVEEVTINKEVSQRQQQINDTVRHTEVEVEQLGAGSARSSMMSDDDYYRNHFTSNYGSTGDSYDDYAPAYSYGSEMARNGKYSGRQWDDVETDLSSDWATRAGNKAGSTWAKMKAAVKHGWDRMTNDDDDSYYRNHYASSYGASGDSYDSYKPAYSYGSDMRRDQKYSGRQWDDAESDLRSDWDSRYPSDNGVSTWDKTKAAVKHGWDRMTNDDDDSYYRNHYNATYSTTGDDFDTYQPAYSYGSEMRKSEMYRNRPWDDVEPDLRSSWDARYPNNGVSTWDKMKAAVRHGWDRMTS
ncbi:YsnF/AvaK domain-containing protein [Massilia sp. YIM B02769]|uniref:YsnF/AvaK domain-containing protein n=1 Tax=unclassified Massilia TaxID=2609279 RepID=UPI0025B6956F|nr:MULTISPECIES: YsnF/AvaK domain-containing protein [unclassified Massilia]MDN4059261.1 YsnF/AvaK domain-containing protein [Massilia sp. YIM B02769]